MPRVFHLIKHVYSFYYLLSVKRTALHLTLRVTPQYVQAISSVGSILEYYDSDKRFPVLGFGGCPVPGSPALHCFAVNGQEDDPEVHGVDAILDVYRCEGCEDVAILLEGGRVRGDILQRGVHKSDDVPVI